MSNITTITGLDAINHAAEHGLTLSKYSDPVEDAREGLTVDEAREVATEDASLIYLQVATHVVVEHMSAAWRESHRGNRNWGVYPSNGAVRVLMTREDAEELVEADSDEYDRILRDATVSDMTRYPRETLETLEVVS